MIGLRLCCVWQCVLVWLVIGLRLCVWQPVTRPSSQMAEALPSDATPTFRLETITPDRYTEVARLASTFHGERKRACAIIPCWLCPTSRDELAGPYEKTPELRSLTVVAVRETDNAAVGFVKMRSEVGCQSVSW